jgi:hypothetical protein
VSTRAGTQPHEVVAAAIEEPLGDELEVAVGHPAQLSTALGAAAALRARGILANRPSERRRRPGGSA